jgi:hypothetical protein
MTHHDDDVFVEKSRTLLKHAEAHIDDDTLDELSRRRRQALNEAMGESDQYKNTRPIWAYAGALAPLCLVAMFWFFAPNAEQDWQESDLDMAALDAVIAETLATASLTNEESVAVWDEPVELLDDLEFYSWLAEETHAG